MEWNGGGIAPKKCSGRAPGRRPKLRYLRRSIIGSVRYTINSIPSNWDTLSRTSNLIHIIIIVTSIYIYVLNWMYLIIISQLDGIVFI